MTNQEAIKRIKVHKEIHLMLEPNALLITEALDMAIKALEQQESERWIPASLRLPEEHEKSDDRIDVETLAVVDTEWHMCSDLVEVTVFDLEKEETFVCTDCTCDGKWSNFYDDYEVKAWRPLPEPYTE